MKNGSVGICSSWRQSRHFDVSSSSYKRQIILLKYKPVNFRRWVLMRWESCNTHICVPKKRCKFETGKRKIIPGLDRLLGLQEVQARRIFKQWTHEGDKVQSYAPTVFTPLEKFLVLNFVRSWVDLKALVGPEEISQRKIPMIQRGTEPATFRLRVQCLIELHRRVHHMKQEVQKIIR